MQMPFHFAGDVPPGFGDETLGTPDVLRHFANIGYGDFDYVPDLHRVSKPTLVIVGAQDRTTTSRAARVLHDGIAGGRLVVLPGVGHMSFVETPEPYIEAVTKFLHEAAD
jgi:pimeloyl-ACP methyl ester carboxylesterase